MSEQAYRIRFAEATEAALVDMEARLKVGRAEIIRDALSFYFWAIREHDAGSKLVIDREVVIGRLPYFGEIRGHRYSEFVISTIPPAEEGPS